MQVVDCAEYSSFWHSVAVSIKCVKCCRSVLYGRESNNQKQSLIIGDFRALYIFCKYMLKLKKKDVTHIPYVVEA